MIVLMALIHLGLFTLFGAIIPKIPKQKIELFNVDLVKDVKKANLTKPRPIKEKGIKYQDKKKDNKKPGPKRDNQKPPGPKKPKPPSNAKPPKKDNAAPNLPLKIDLPKQRYPQLNPTAKQLAYKPPKNPHELGAPSGKDDGILGSKGTDGDVKGEGGGDGTGAGGGGGGGAGGGAGGFVPYIFWDYQGTKYGGQGVLSGEESQRMYLQYPDSRPLLANTGAISEAELVNIGNGTVEIKVTVPAVSRVPLNGVRPNFTIISVNPDDPTKVDQMARAARRSLEESGWYPAKKGGQPFEEPFTLILRFYGTHKSSD